MRCCWGGEPNLCDKFPRPAHFELKSVVVAAVVLLAAANA